MCNVYCIFTCEGVLCLKESAEPSLHVGQTALVLPSGLLLQVTGCHTQLVETERGERGGSPSVRGVVCVYYFVCVTECMCAVLE